MSDDPYRGVDPWRGPDPILARILANAPPEDRQVLAHTFGEADLISRHLPAYAIPGVIRACWLQVVALHAEVVGDAYAVTLDNAAREMLIEVTGTMEVLVTRAPPDARSIDS